MPASRPAIPANAGKLGAREDTLAIVGAILAIYGLGRL